MLLTTATEVSTVKWDTTLVCRTRSRRCSSSLRFSLRLRMHPRTRGKSVFAQCSLEIIRMANTRLAT